MSKNDDFCASINYDIVKQYWEEAITWQQSLWLMMNAQF